MYWNGFSCDPSHGPPVLSSSTCQVVQKPKAGKENKNTLKMVTLIMRALIFYHHKNTTQKGRSENSQSQKEICFQTSKKLLQRYSYPCSRKYPFFKDFFPWKEVGKHCVSSIINNIPDYADPTFATPKRTFVFDQKGEGEQRLKDFSGYLSYRSENTPRQGSLCEKRGFLIRFRYGQDPLQQALIEKPQELSSQACWSREILPAPTTVPQVDLNRLKEWK